MVQNVLYTVIKCSHTTGYSQNLFTSYEINVSYKNIGQIEIKNLLKAEPCLTEWHNIVSESSQKIEKKTTEEEVVEYIRRATVCLVS